MRDGGCDVWTCDWAEWRTSWKQRGDEQVGLG